MLRSNKERFRQWYLRWLERAVIPTDAHLTVSILEGLSYCVRLVVLVVAGRRRRAYKRSKADTRGTVDGEFGRARFPGCADVVLLRRWYQAVGEMVLGLMMVVPAI
jgi:hypothetical protein